MISDNTIVIGKIISTHGIDGWLAIESYSYPREKNKYLQYLLDCR